MALAGRRQRIDDDRFQEWEMVASVAELRHSALFLVGARLGPPKVLVRHLLRNGIFHEHSLVDAVVDVVVQAGSPEMAAVAEYSNVMSDLANDCLLEAR